MSVVRNHFTIEAISQRHESHGNVIERILINIWKGRAYDCLLTVFTIMITLNFWHRRPNRCEKDVDSRISIEDEGGGELRSQLPTWNHHRLTSSVSACH